MCGRAACSLNPETLCRACEYENATGKRQTISWTKSDVEYVPSTNIGPKDVLPCIIAGSHCGEENERVLCAMMWSMIPPWHEGDYKKHSLSTHNARLENIKNSKLYNSPLRNGQRCIIICEGYYEWKAGKTKKDTKQPYYIYANQRKEIEADDPSTWEDKWSEQDGWQGFKVLKMAGIFNKFKTKEDKMIYSCTIITTEANSVLSWLHNRVPLFINKEQDLRLWLNEKLSIDEAIDKLNKLTLSEDDLNWHTVSTRVNNVLYKNEDCRKKTKAIGEKKSNSTSFMASWLKKGSAESAKRKTTETGKDDNRPTKITKEN
ncbi:abasic site processing protein HMCES [Frieseomelitta varia]|uniref:abasic site processing protein HMCES n=1 Tax=Frieseomelitta varia TaxID=561572 RepID=UPI001CB69C38|nr:abasic site processing protein HMCES [Frieseomelitta varia]